MLNPPPVFHQRQDGYSISTDRSQINLAFVHGYLHRSYWSKGIPYEVVARAVENSLPFGVYLDAQQVGFARIITDFTALAYLADVFITEEHQGKGLGKWLVASILAHPQLQGIRRWLLFTQDAHSLYKQFGFELIPGVEERLMGWNDPAYPSYFVQQPTENDS